MAKQYINDGTILQCDKGSAPSKLTVTSSPTSFYKGMKWATEMDMVFGTNIQPFGTCSALYGKPCNAVTLKWNNLAETVCDSKKNKFLLSHSELPCSIGGKITTTLSDVAPAPLDTNLAGLASGTSGSGKGNNPSNTSKTNTIGKINETKTSLEQNVDKPLPEDNDLMENVGVMGELLSEAPSFAPSILDSIGNLGSSTNTNQTHPLLTTIPKGNSALTNVLSEQSPKPIGEYWGETGNAIDQLLVASIHGGEAAFSHQQNKSNLFLDSLSDQEAIEQMKVNTIRDLAISEDLNNLLLIIPEADTESINNGTENKLNTEIKTNQPSQSKLIVDSTFDSSVSKLKNNLAGNTVDALLSGDGIGSSVSSLNFKSAGVGFLKNAAMSVAMAKIPGAQEAMALYGKYNKLKQLKSAVTELKNALTKPNSNPGVAIKVIPDPPPKLTKKNIVAEQAKKAGKTGSASSDNRSEGGDPVDLITGAVLYYNKDFTIPGIIPVIWNRSWYSDSAYKGPMGYGFHHSYDMSIQKFENQLLLTLEDGRPTFFPVIEKNSSFYNRQEKLTLTYTESETFELNNHKKQLTYAFSKIGTTHKLTEIYSESGNKIKLVYQDELLTEIIDTAHRKIKIHYSTNNRIEEINIHHKGKQRTLINYQYNSNGDLITITDALRQSIHMVYENHLMISKTGRNNNSFYWEYDTMQFGAKCVRTWGAGGFLENTIAYYQDHNIVTNALGHQTTYYFENNVATKIISPTGIITSKEYNEYQELSKVTVGEQEFLYSYDEQGNVSDATLPNGNTIESYYDEDGILKLITLPNEKTAVVSHKNQLIDTIVSPDGNSTSFEYDTLGRIIVVTEEHGAQTKYSYDDDHNIVQLELPNGANVNFVYDAWGQCIRMTNPNNLEYKIAYDALGRINEVQSPDGQSHKIQFDAYNKVTQISNQNRTTDYKYTPTGRMTSIQIDDRNILARYDNEGQFTGIINQDKQSYTFVRDTNGLIVKEIEFDKSTRTFHRDQEGKIVTIERQNGNQVIYEYNTVGQVSRVEYYDGNWVTFAYDKNGLLLRATTPVSDVIFTRDEEGRVINEHQNGYDVATSYNEQGHRDTIKSSIGASIKSTYHATGHLDTITASHTNSPIWECKTGYNKQGAPIRKEINSGITINFDHSFSSKTLTQSIVKGAQLLEKKSYTWNQDDLLKSTKNHLKNHSTQNTYDEFHKLVATKYEDGTYDNKYPDATGNLYTTKEQDDRVYENNKLISSKGASYEYDEEGQLIEKTTVEGVYQYFWGADGLLEQVSCPDRSIVQMQYDALGRRISKTIRYPHNSNKTSIIHRYLWNGSILLHEWNYPLENKPKTKVKDDGSIALDGKEPIDHLTTWVFKQGTFRPIAKIEGKDTHTINTDPIGTPIVMYDQKGQPTWEARYNNYGKIKKLYKGTAIQCSFRYLGQYDDPEIGLYYNRFRYYDPNEGLYISKDPIRIQGGLNLYGYADANSLAQCDVLGLMAGVLPEHIQRHNQLETHHLESDGSTPFTPIINPLLPPQGLPDPESHLCTALLYQSYGLHIDIRGNNGFIQGEISPFITTNFLDVFRAIPSTEGDYFPPSMIGSLPSGRENDRVFDGHDMQYLVTAYSNTVKMGGFGIAIQEGIYTGLWNGSNNLNPKVLMMSEEEYENWYQNLYLKDLKEDKLGNDLGFYMGRITNETGKDFKEISEGMCRVEGEAHYLDKYLDK